MAFAIGESLGWPLLTQPIQKALQVRLGRNVELGPAHIHFWGGVALQSPLLEIGAPGWSKSPYLLRANDVNLQLRYSDLWRAYWGEPLVVQSLGASQLEAYLERSADAGVSWQWTTKGPTSAIPRVESMAVRAGQIHYTDVPLSLALDAQFTLTATEAPAASPSSPTLQVLDVRAQGRYREDVFRATLLSSGDLPWEVRADRSAPAALSLAASVGRARLAFNGTVQDLQHLDGLHVAFTVQGPSLAALGAPLGVTLPTTHAFDVNGILKRQGTLWTVDLNKAQVGESVLGGAFTFDTESPVPKLTGRVDGSLLKLADLWPAIGGAASKAAPTASQARSKVLPSRPFNLAALRVMDSDVTIAIAQVDANLRQLEPLRPFSAHLLLTGGVLSLTDIEARTAQGHLRGTIALDGQANTAHWVAALRWDGLQLQRWIRQTRRAGLPPYVSGLLQGHATLQGNGRSTAEILATLQGDIGARVTKGTVSHLLVEAGGLDVAEVIGVYLQGDKPLVLDCAVASLTVDKGVLRPRLLVIDTTDSTAWVDGTLSLATETLDLRAVTAPKDFSVLTLRSPLHINGSFALPVVSVEAGPVALKLGAALALGLVNPLAAFIPLVDLGGKAAASAKAADCRAGVR